MGKRAWRGVAWPPIVGGRCTKHQIAVSTLSGLCFLCHQEQLDAARRGSREWEKAAR